MKITTWMGVILLTTVLSGCGILQIPTYDAGEYAELVQVVYESSHGTCEKEQTERLEKLTGHLLAYVSYLPHNGLMAQSVAVMNKSVQELNSTEQPISASYCRLKLRTINFMATEMAKTSGGKVR